MEWKKNTIESLEDHECKFRNCNKVEDRTEELYREIRGVAGRTYETE